MVNVCHCAQVISFRNTKETVTLTTSEFWAASINYLITKSILILSISKSVNFQSFQNRATVEPHRKVKVIKEKCCCFAQFSFIIMIFDIFNRRTYFSLQLCNKNITPYKAPTHGPKHHRRQKKMLMQSNVYFFYVLTIGDMNFLKRKIINLLQQI